MKQKILLINPNLMKPPISPVGLDYIAIALEQAGYEIDFVDLCHSENISETLDSIMDEEWDYLFIGISIRNVDDSYFASRDFCLEKTAGIINLIREKFESPDAAPAQTLNQKPDRRPNRKTPPIVLGGVGFSIFPKAVMDYCKADFGIIGDPESSLIKLAKLLERNSGVDDVATIPGLVYMDSSTSGYIQNPPSFESPYLSLARRTLSDHTFYFQQGGMIGFETKRGCPRKCAYCADPIAKGRTLRYRNPVDVADELEFLLEKGVTHFHTCDSEFNTNREHLLAVCEEIIRRGLGKKIQWYAYCVPTPFDDEIAETMKKAGCCGIDFTVDSLDDVILASLNHPHTHRDVVNTVNVCCKYSIATMLDMLIGVPGESRITIERTIDRSRSIPADCIGISLGVRLYPGTPLWQRVKKDIKKSGHSSVTGLNPEDFDHLKGNDEFLLMRPVFFLENTLGDDVADFLIEYIDGDKRFMFGGSGTKAKNYNYNQNKVLVDALKEGHRGAYWHILSQYS